MTGLIPGTTYSNQIVAGNSLGTNFGSWLNFTCGHIVVVTDVSDAAISPGSLRVIVNQAGAGDTITFTNTLSGATIIVSLGSITLAKNLIIDASALPGGITLNGANGKIITINSGVSVVLNALTITNGGNFVGSAIENLGGTLTLNQCALTGNGVIYHVSGSAINNSGILTLNQCTLTGNGSGDSVGITSGGPVTLNQCTVSGNMGGIRMYNSQLTVFNSIVAGNQFFNIIFQGGGTLNKTGVNLIDVAPQLAPLGNYGGPTQTRPPLPGSPAIDACTNGIDPSLTTDQRGFPRIVGLYADIGAVEGVYNPAGPGILTGMNRAANGPASFTFTNSTDMSFTVLATTNVAWPLNLWSNLGSVVESPAGSGHYQFTDSSGTNSPQRFYRVSSP